MRLRVFRCMSSRGWHSSVLAICAVGEFKHAVKPRRTCMLLACTCVSLYLPLTFRAQYFGLVIRFYVLTRLSSLLRPLRSHRTRRLLMIQLLRIQVLAPANELLVATSKKVKPTLCSFVKRFPFSLLFITVHRKASGCICYGISVCLSVRLYVALRYSVETRERRGMRSSPSGSPPFLVFCCQEWLIEDDHVQVKFECREVDPCENS